MEEIVLRRRIRAIPLDLEYFMVSTQDSGKIRTVWTNDAEMQGQGPEGGRETGRNTETDKQLTQSRLQK